MIYEREESEAAVNTMGKAMLVYMLVASSKAACSCHGTCLPTIAFH